MDTKKREEKGLKKTEMPLILFHLTDECLTFVDKNCDYVFVKETEGRRIRMPFLSGKAVICVRVCVALPSSLSVLACVFVFMQH